MMNRRKKLRTDSRGQLLIVAALVIAILISSTTVYVYELGTEAISSNASFIGDLALALKQVTRNAMISSLANASNGGERTVLATYLNGLTQAVRRLNHLAAVTLNFAVLNDTNYDMGTWLSWNNDGAGISGTDAVFSLRIQDGETDVAANYEINVTTAITITCSYTMLESSGKLVNLTCNVFSEGKPALAKNMTLFYQDAETWIPVNSANNLSITDNGNGTYLAAFIVQTTGTALPISVHVHDMRGIFVQANATCLEA